jgi:4-aminobutyrate aminotransferase-like enzyme
VLGNGGQQDYPADFYRWVREICDEEDVLLIVDEVQTGAARGGTMWACDHYGLRPDIVVWGKGFGGGFPLAGALLREGLRGYAAGDDSVTFGQFPVSLAAGLATIDLLLDENLEESSRTLGAHATARLRELQEVHPLIGDIRCPGLNIGIELVRDRVTKEPAPLEAGQVYRRAQELGVMLGTSHYAGLGHVLKIKPPLNIPQDQLDTAIDVLDRALGEVEAGAGLRS